MNESQKYGLVLGLLVLVWLGLLIACMGCQTVGGLCRDIESAARYGHEHTIVEK
jgi:hypothetical protein